MSLSYNKELALENAEGDFGAFQTRYVNAYEARLGYGGPEEGGWWYDDYEPLATIKVRSDTDMVSAYNYLDAIYGEQYKDLPKRSSVASDACDLCIFVEEKQFESVRDSRPHYE